MKSGQFVYFVFFLVAPFLLKGQSDTLVRLPEVEVDASLVHSKLRRIPGSISVLATDDLLKSNNINFAEQLNAIPGLYVQSGALNTNRVIIRGIGSRTPYASNRIRAYLNEIPITNGDGVTVLEDIDVAQVGRVEVLKGPSGALYGSGLGGTIRLFTPSTPSKTSVKVETQGGSFGTLRTNAGVNFQFGDTQFSGTMGRVRSDGFRENSEYNRSSALFLGEKKTEKTNIGFLLNYIDLESQIASSLNKTDFESNPEKAASNWLKVQGYERYKKLIAGVSIQQRIAENTSGTISIFSGYFDEYESRPFNILDDHSINYGTRGKLIAQLGKFQLVSGFEWYAEKYNWSVFETNDGLQGELLNRNSENRSYLNLFGLSYFQVSEKLLLTAGININKLDYGLRDRFPANGDQSGRYGFPLIVSPRLGFNYSATPSFSVYGSVGHGFSAPSLEESLLPEGEVNSGLKSEQGVMTELGSRIGIFNDRLFLDMTVYSIHLKNLLVTKRLSEDTFTGINAGETNHFGLEILAKWIILKGNQFPGKLELNSSAAFSKNEFSSFVDDGIDFSGNQLPGIPRSTINETLSWFPAPRYFVHVVYQRTGKQFLNDSNLGTYHSNQTVSVKTGYTFQWMKNTKIILFTGVQNVFDAKYASMILVNASAFGNNLPRYYYPGSPRNWHAGLRLEF